MLLYWSSTSPGHMPTCIQQTACLAYTLLTTLPSTLSLHTVIDKRQTERRHSHQRDLSCCNLRACPLSNSPAARQPATVTSHHAALGVGLALPGPLCGLRWLLLLLLLVVLLVWLLRQGRQGPLLWLLPLLVLL